jgi:hypothetical protein
MNSLTKYTVWDAFDRVDVSGRPMAVCKLCHRQVAANTGVMCMHHRMKHGSGNKMLGSGDGGNESRDAHKSTEHELDEPFHTPTHIPSQDSGRSAVEKQALVHAKNAVKHLAVCCDPTMYGGIIKHATAGVLRTIQNIARDALAVGEQMVTPSEGTVLHRYRKQLRAIADDGSDEESLRRKLLAPPQKRVRHAPESMNYMPVAILLNAENGYGWMDENVSIASESDVAQDSDASGDGSDEADVSSESPSESGGSDDSGSIDSDSAGGTELADESEESGEGDDSEEGSQSRGSERSTGDEGTSDTSDDGSEEDTDSRSSASSAGSSAAENDSATDDADGSATVDDSDADTTAHDQDARRKQAFLDYYTAQYNGGVVLNTHAAAARSNPVRRK